MSMENSKNKNSNLITVIYQATRAMNPQTPRKKHLIQSKANKIKKERQQALKNQLAKAYGQSNKSIQVQALKADKHLIKYAQSKATKNQSISPKYFLSGKISEQTLFRTNQNFMKQRYARTPQDYYCHIDNDNPTVNQGLAQLHKKDKMLLHSTNNEQKLQNMNISLQKKEKKQYQCQIKRQISNFSKTSRNIKKKTLNNSVMSKQFSRKQSIMKQRIQLPDYRTSIREKQWLNTTSKSNQFAKNYAAYISCTKKRSAFERRQKIMKQQSKQKLQQKYMKISRRYGIAPQSDNTKRPQNSLFKKLSAKKVQNYKLQDNNLSFNDVDRSRLSTRSLKNQESKSMVKQTNSFKNICAQKSKNKSDDSLRRVDKSTKIYSFSINSKDEQVKQILFRNNWKQWPVKTENSNLTLKWLYNQSPCDYQLLKNKNPPFNKKSKDFRTTKFFNHIKNNLLVTKIGLLQLSKKLIESGKKVHQYLPITYDLDQQSDCLNFYESYKLNIIKNILFKAYHYIKGKIPEQSFSCKMTVTVEEIYDYLKKNQQQKVVSYIQWKKQNRNSNFKLNIILLIYTLVYAQSIIYQRYELQHNEQSVDGNLEQFDLKYEGILKNQNILKALYKFSKADQPYDHYHDIKFSSPSIPLNLGTHLISKQKQMHPKLSGTTIKNNLFSILNDNTIRSFQVRNFYTPSIQFCVCLKNVYDKIIKLSDEPMSNNNMWIVKPSAGSKGIGIQLINKLEDARSICWQPYNRVGNNKIIQKYVQNIWILNDKILFKQTLQLDELIKQKIWNKKFDIRQWVLINPPDYYIFSQFYLKICSKQYNPNPIFLKQLLGHLSNYSLNRENFAADEQLTSVMSQTDFHSILRKLYDQQKISKLMSKIKTIISELVEQMLKNCEIITGCFQIIGFDIIIDQQLNPWILEANMSPACSERAHWLTKMHKTMLQKALTIVLPSYMLPNQNYTQQTQYYWQKLGSISEGTIENYQKDINLQIMGQKKKIYKKKAVISN